MDDETESQDISAVDPSLFSDPTPITAMLDLDDLDTPQLPVTIAGKVYPMTGKGDLSMADREEMRLVMAHLNQMQDIPEGYKGLNESQRSVYLDLELRLCRIALPTAPKKVLTELNARQRNALIDRFFQEADVAAMIQQFVAMQHRMQQQAMQQTAPKPQPLRPMQQNKTKASKPPMPPADLVAPTPFSSITASETGT